MAPDQDKKNAKPTDALSKARSRRAEAELNVRRTDARIIRLLMQEELRKDSHYQALLSQEAELRHELHMIRLGATKKRGRLIRLLHECVRLSEILETSRTLETDVSAQLGTLRDSVHAMELAAQQQAVTAAAGSAPLVR